MDRSARQPELPEFLLVASLCANLVLAVWLGTIVTRRQALDARADPSRLEVTRGRYARLAREQSELLGTLVATRDRIAIQTGENTAWLHSAEREEMQARSRALSEEANQYALETGEHPQGGD